MSSYLIKQFIKGIALRGETTDITENVEGSLFHNSTQQKIKSYIEGAVREVITESQIQTLTNKTISAADNLIVVASTNPNLTSVELNNALTELQTDIDSNSGNLSSHIAALDPHPQYETSVEAQSKVDAHANRVDNPHSVTKTQVGLSNVDNTSDANKPISTATQTALNSKYDSSNPAGYVNSAQAAAAAPVQSVAGKVGAVSLTKSDVGLANVDNTSDANKPISTATQTALNSKLDASQVGLPNGAASLDGAGKVPAAQLPSYVDDVVEAANLAALPVTGETGKIYVTLDDNKAYRWSGTVYVEVSPSIGTTWGSITGSLINQTDLQSALNAKANSVHTHVSSDITDFNESVDDRISTTIVAGSNISATYNDLANTLTIASTVSVITDHTALSSIGTNSHTEIDSHIASTSNPHSVTKSQVGLSNVDNTSDANKPISTATQTALNAKQDTLGFTPENVSNKSTSTSLGTSDTLYPTQNAVKAYVDGSVSSSSTPDATTEIKGKLKLAGDLAGTADSPTVPGLATKEPTITAGTTSQYFRGDKTFQTLDKSAVGLSNVDNTSDSNKPISTATQTALNAKLDASQVGLPNGAASLDGTGKVPSSQLPSYVDDVVEGANLAAFPVTGETSKIYVALDSGKCYRWSGSTYVEVSPSEVNSVAGKVGIVTLDKSDVGLSNVDNTSDANKPISTATQTALNAKANTSHTHVATDITDLSEAIDDRISSTIVAGTNVTVNYDDLANTLTISAAGGGSGGATTLDGLTDVSVPSPSNGQALVYNTTTSLWEAQTISSGSGGATELNGLNDVTLSGTLDNQILRYDLASTQWKNETLLKDDIGLSNVDNTSDTNKPISTATQTALNAKANSADVYTKTESDANFEPKNSNIQSHISSTSNPHSVTKAQVGLGNVDNTSDLDKPISTATQTALNAKANSVHTHVSTDVTDFSEAVDDRVSSLLVAGSNITLSYDDLANTLSISAVGAPASTSAERLITNVFNASGSPIPKMSAIYISGIQGDQPRVVLAQANLEMSSSKTYGLVQTDIPNMSAGVIVEQGRLENLDTDVVGWVEGDPLWLSPTIPGGITNVKPSAPNHAVFIGYLIRKHQNVGVIQVSIQNGYELNELHNVAINGIANAQVIQYESATSLWKNHTLVKADVGLSNVDNTADLNKPISTATQTALDLITDINWTGDYNNGVTYTVGDGVMFNGASFRMIVAIGAAGYNPAAYPANWLQVTEYVSANDIGLGNVDNTSDANKPISTATQTALNGKANTIHTHVAADITDFNSAVDARLPVIPASVSSVNGDSGPDVILDSDDIQEGTTNLYLTNERVDDRVKDLLIAGSGISLTYDDNANSLTVAATGGGGSGGYTEIANGGTLSGTYSGNVYCVGTVSFSGNVTVKGNLVAEGKVTNNGGYSLTVNGDCILKSEVDFQTNTGIAPGNITIDGDFHTGERSTPYPLRNIVSAGTIYNVGGLDGVIIKSAEVVTTASSGYVVNSFLNYIDDYYLEIFGDYTQIFYLSMFSSIRIIGGPNDGIIAAVSTVNYDGMSGNTQITLTNTGTNFSGTETGIQICPTTVFRETGYALSSYMGQDLVIVGGANNGQTISYSNSINSFNDPNEFTYYNVYSTVNPISNPFDTFGLSKSYYPLSMNNSQLAFGMVGVALEIGDLILCQDGPNSGISRAVTNISMGLDYYLITMDSFPNNFNGTEFACQLGTKTILMGQIGTTGNQLKFLAGPNSGTICTIGTGGTTMPTNPLEGSYTYTRITPVPNAINAYFDAEILNYSSFDTDYEYGYNQNMAPYDINIFTKLKFHSASSNPNYVFTVSKVSTNLAYGSQTGGGIELATPALNPISTSDKFYTLDDMGMLFTWDTGSSPNVIVRGSYYTIGGLLAEGRSGNLSGANVVIYGNVVASHSNSSLVGYDIFNGAKISVRGKGNGNGGSISVKGSVVSCSLLTNCPDDQTTESAGNGGNISVGSFDGRFFAKHEPSYTYSSANLLYGNYVVTQGGFSADSLSGNAGFFKCDTNFIGSGIICSGGFSRQNGIGNGGNAGELYIGGRCTATTIDATAGTAWYNASYKGLASKFYIGGDVYYNTINVGTSVSYYSVLLGNDTTSTGYDNSATPIIFRSNVTGFTINGYVDGIGVVNNYAYITGSSRGNRARSFLITGDLKGGNLTSTTTGNNPIARVEVIGNVESCNISVNILDADSNSLSAGEVIISGNVTQSNIGASGYYTDFAFRKGGNGGYISIAGNVIGGTIDAVGLDRGTNGPESKGAGNGGTISIGGSVNNCRLLAYGGDLEGYSSTGRAGNGGSITIDGDYTHVNSSTSLSVKGGYRESSQDQGIAGNGGTIDIRGKCITKGDITISGGSNTSLSVGGSCGSIRFGSGCEIGGTFSASDGSGSATPPSTIKHIVFNGYCVLNFVVIANRVGVRICSRLTLNGITDTKATPAYIFGSLGNVKLTNGNLTQTTQNANTLSQVIRYSTSGDWYYVDAGNNIN